MDACCWVPPSPSSRYFIFVALLMLKTPEMLLFFSISSFPRFMLSVLDKFAVVLPVTIAIDGSVAALADRSGDSLDVLIKFRSP